MKYYFKKGKGHLLIPADNRTAKFLERIKEGTGLEVKIGSYRNVDFHRKYLKLLRIAWTNSPEEYNMSFDSFRKFIVAGAGFFEPGFAQTFSGETIVIKQAKSIAFDKMSSEEFKELYDRSKDFVMTEVMQGEEIEGF